MEGMLLAPIIQVVGIGIPLIGCFALFKKQQSRVSLSLFMTNLMCLIINYAYLLLLSTDNPDVVISTLKILYLGNALFYIAFILFISNYLQLGNTKLRTFLLALWAVLECVILFLLWIDDPLHLVFADAKIHTRQLWDITYVESTSGPLYWLRNLILCIVLTSGLIYTIVRMCRVNLKEEKENLGRLCGAQFIIVLSIDLSFIFHMPFDGVPICGSVAILSIIIGVIQGEFFRVTDQGRNWVVEHTDNALIITDNQYGFLDANPAAIKIFPELAHKEKNTFLPKEIVKLFKDENPAIQFKDRFYTKEVASIEQKSRVIGYSMLLVDNTEHYELMEQIEAEKERAEEANRAKSQFMSNMSHEIRTPMNAIVGMTDILLRQELSTQNKEYIKNIKSSGNALLTIINDILDFSKIEAGKMDIIEDDYQPMSVVNDLSMIFLNRIGEKNVELIYDIAPELPDKLHGDALRIRQVIINLMNNAIKFTEEGYVKLTVRVTSVDVDTVELLYMIEDTGEGIKEEDLARLFKNYQQVDKVKNHYREGTGLGLSLSKQMVELMGGTISVSSEYGKGSTFSFTLPQKVCSSKKAASVKEESVKNTVVCGKFINPLIEEQYQKLVTTFGLKTVQFENVYSKEAHATIVFTDDIDILTTDVCRRMSEYKTKLCVLQNPMKQNLSDKQATLINKPLYSLNFCQTINGETITSDEEKEALCFVAPDAKILIVDDHEMNLKVAKGLLEPLKLQIDTAENGKQALEKVKKNNYDMVFMDHMMPIMNGIEATQEIRKLGGKYLELPIIALSANATVEAKELFKEKGFFDFVPKPIKLKELCGCIRRWLPLESIIYEKTEGETKSQENIGNDFPVIKGLDVQEGIENCGSKELFLNLLGDFYKLIDQKSTKIEKLLADGLLQDYTIEVHALKSTARMIGAMELSEKFYQLEQLGNEEDQKTLEIKTPDVLSLYRSFKEILKPYGKMKEQDKKTVPKEQIINDLMQLKDAIDCFDLDGADEAMHRIESYVFPEDCQGMVESLSAFVADVAMEEIMELTETLIEELKK